MEQKTGVITDIIFYNDTNGYLVAEMETENELLTVVGNVFGVKEGMKYTLTGEFTTHPRYGEQFKFSQAELRQPTSADEILKFLSSGAISGIRDKTAAALVEEFGDRTLMVIAHDPDLLTRVPGIGSKTAKKIADSYAENMGYASVALTLAKFGIDSSTAMKIYGEYGAESVKAVEENPYRLIDTLRGFGFKKADQIASKMGFAGDDPFRVKSGIRYCLYYYADMGSTYVPRDSLLEKTAALLDLTREQVAENLLAMAFEGDVKIEDMDGTDVVYLDFYYEAERDVVRNIMNISGSELKTFPMDIDSIIGEQEAVQGIELSDEQRDVVRSSVSYGLMVITGGPGTGKTTIIKNMIGAFESAGMEVALAAPTGRAAKRMEEATGHRASTIHRLLDYYGSDADDQAAGFARNSENPVECDVVIVDEASMIDLLLMRALTEALAPGTRLILVGDADQLPAVGAGNVLRDLIGSGFVKTFRLNEIFRQASGSGIITNAHSIDRGDYPDCGNKSGDFFMMRKAGDDKILDLIVSLVSVRLPNYYKFDPMNDIQVLTPTHKGLLGTVSLNNALQQALNPGSEDKAEKSMGNTVFREGDKVMQTKNRYSLEWRIPDEGTVGNGVFNGDIGLIDSIDTEENVVTVCFDGNRYVDYEQADLKDLELAYAMTVHKSQGNEFPAVVMPSSFFPPLLATRNLLYTAVTRAEKLVVICGSEQRLDAMVDNNRTALRYSGLRERLGNMVEFAG